RAGVLAGMMLAWQGCLLCGWHVGWRADPVAMQPARQPPTKKACGMAGNRRSLPHMIIALVNSKGGVGKSTLAGNLAGWLHHQGNKVILADCDSQQSSSEWL